MASSVGQKGIVELQAGIARGVGPVLPLDHVQGSTASIVHSDLARSTVVTMAHWRFLNGR